MKKSLNALLENAFEKIIKKYGNGTEYKISIQSTPKGKFGRVCELNLYNKALQSSPSIVLMPDVWGGLVLYLLKVRPDEGHTTDLKNKFVEVHSKMNLLDAITIHPKLSLGDIKNVMVLKQNDDAIYRLWAELYTMIVSMFYSGTYNTLQPKLYSVK